MFFPKETTLLQKVLFISACAASLTLLVLFMHNYAVDVLMADRLDTWNLLFNNASFWEGFTAQHGPHRVGLLFVFSKLGYVLGHTYDTRFDLFVNAAAIWCMVPLGMWVKYKITETFNWYDLLIPFLVTASWQWATLILNPHIHVLLPLFTLLFAALLVSKFRNNILLNGILIFSAIFSVYAIFAAMLFVSFQSIKWMKEKKWIHLSVIIAITLGTLYFYFNDFRWSTLSSANQFNIIQVLKAPVLIVSNFLYVSNWIGLTLILVSALVLIGFIRKFGFYDSKKVATLFMLSSMVTFVFFQSIGRSGDYSNSFSAFRYYTELVLFLWVVAILAGQLNTNKLMSALIFIGFSWVLFQPNNPKRGDWIAYTQNLETLKKCVLETQNFKSCNRDLQLQVHAHPEKGKVVEKWLLLEQRKQTHLEAK